MRGIKIVFFEDIEVFDWKRCINNVGYHKNPLVYPCLSQKILKKIFRHGFLIIIADSHRLYGNERKGMPLGPGYAL